MENRVRPILHKAALIRNVRSHYEPALHETGVPLLGRDVCGKHAFLKDVYIFPLPTPQPKGTVITWG